VPLWKSSSRTDAAFGNAHGPLRRPMNAAVQRQPSDPPAAAHPRWAPVALFPPVALALLLHRRHRPHQALESRTRRRPRDTALVVGVADAQIAARREYAIELIHGVPGLRDELQKLPHEHQIEGLIGKAELAHVADGKLNRGTADKEPVGAEPVGERFGMLHEARLDVDAVHQDGG